MKLSFTMLKPFIAAYAFLCIVSTHAHAIGDDELQATLIARFLQYIEWPGEKAISKQSKIDICVLGDSNIIRTNKFKEASTEKLMLNVVGEQNINAIATHCHVLFISNSEEGAITDIMSILKGKPVLTIGDTDGFSEKGVMIGFVVVDKRVKFIINKRAADAAGLRIGAQLLEIALKVIP